MSNNICLSHLVSRNTPSYGNRDSIIIRTNSAIQNNSGANTSTWIFSNNHIGTHIDAPYHFCNNGEKTFEIPVDDYVFNHIQLVDIPCVAGCLIGIDEIKQFDINSEIELLLIRTGFENYRQEDRYWNDNPGIAPELANYLRENYPKLRCIGFDFISLTSWKFRMEGRESHKAFLCSSKGTPILVIEDMSLKAIDGYINWLIVAPLFVEDGNGGAVTVFANQNK